MPLFRSYSRSCSRSSRQSKKSCATPMNESILQQSTNTKPPKSTKPTKSEQPAKGSLPSKGTKASPCPVKDCCCKKSKSKKKCKTDNCCCKLNESESEKTTNKSSCTKKVKSEDQKPKCTVKFDEPKSKRPLKYEEQKSKCPDKKSSGVFEGLFNKSKKRNEPKMNTDQKNCEQPESCKSSSCSLQDRKSCEQPKNCKTNYAKPQQSCSRPACTPAKKCMTCCKAGNNPIM